MTTQPPTKLSHQPLRFELMQAQDYARYLLDRKSEVLFVLKALQKGRCALSAYFDDSEDFTLTSILDVADDRIVLDAPTDSAAMARATSARRLVIVTSHEKVKIQFSVSGARAASRDGRPCLEADLPDRLLRLQRREYFRLIAQTNPPLRCALDLIGADGNARTVEAEVVDLSGGGVAILAPPAGMSFEVGQLFENCRLELPGTGVVKAKLRVCNVFAVSLANGGRVQRCGCQFIGLPGTGLALIERYIMRIERERRVRESGFG